MNKWDFVKKVAAEVGQSQDLTNRVLTKIVEVLVAEVRDNGEQIALPGLGTFKQKSAQARVGRNPMNGEKVNIPASRTIAFKAQTSIKVIEK
jgi:nucleoid DNA-binding protein